MSTPASDNPKLVNDLFRSRRVLFIGAHPDDIEFYCGGLVYQLRKAGVGVLYLIATRGGKGRKGHAGERLRSLRTQDQMKAAEVLGGAEVAILDYPDGQLADHVAAFAADMKTHIEHTAPDYVFCWDSDSIYNPHPDHQAAADACRIGLDGAKASVMCYGTRKPDVRIVLDDESYQAKMRSLRAHRTETPWYYWPIVCRDVRSRLSRGARGLAYRFAEAFRANIYI